MFRPLHAPAGSLTVNRIIETLNEGRRIIIKIEAADETHEVELRLSENGVYYVDGPLSLSTHTSEQEMRHWLIDQDYATK